MYMMMMMMMRRRRRRRRRSLFCIFIQKENKSVITSYDKGNENGKKETNKSFL
jgi:hypothetical protein